MEKKLQDQAWALLPDGFKKNVQNMRKGIIGQPFGLSIIPNQVRLNVLNQLFGRHNLTTGELPRFKAGDKVKVSDNAALCTCAGKIGTIVRGGQCCKGDGWVLDISKHVFLELELEPYTESEAKPTEIGGVKEETKELNLCELLKGCEGMEFYSPYLGNCILDDLDWGDDDHCIRLKNKENGQWVAIPACGHEEGGELMLFPSKDCRTWEGWRPPRKRWKPKDGDTYYWFDSHDHVRNYCWNNDTIDNSMFTSDNCFRTEEQAKEAAKRVREVLEKYHEEIGE